MTNKRMTDLLKELNIDENAIFTVDCDKIIENVTERAEVPYKSHVVSFRRTAKLLPIACAVAVVLLMAITTVAFNSGGGFWTKIFPMVEEATDTYDLYAVEDRRPKNKPDEIETEIPTEEPTEEEVNPNYESPIFDKYHKEEPEKAKEYLENIYDSVEDENYMLILNEIMGDNKNLYITVTVVAKNDEANELLSDESYGWFRVEAYDETMGWSRVGGGTDEIINQRREDSRSYTMHIFGDDHLANGYEQMRITCRAFSTDMEGERYVYFEIEKKSDVIEFELLGQDFEGGYISISPMSLEIIVPKEPTAEYAPDARNLNTFFKFKNGSIRTYNQVAGFDFSSSYVGGDAKLYKFQAGTKNVLDIERLESVIVKGIEYPVDNPENYTETDVPDSLKPFVLAEEGLRHDETYYACSVQQLSACVDITYEEHGVVEFTFGGKSYRAEADNLTVIINESSEYTLYLAPYADENGDVWVGSEFLSFLLGIRRDEIGETGTYLMVP